MPKTQRPPISVAKTIQPFQSTFTNLPSYDSPTVRTTRRPIIMNPVTLRTTRSPPAVSSTLSPETLMMNEMRNYIVDHMPATLKPAIQKPRTLKPRTQKPKPQKPRTQKPRTIIMNPVTLRTTTRRTPAVSSTLSPETLMMNQMRGIISYEGRDSMCFLSVPYLLN